MQESKASSSLIDLFVHLYLMRVTFTDGVELLEACYD